MCGRPKNSKRNSKPILEKEYKILKSYINGMDTFQTTKTKWLRSLEILYMTGMRVSEILDIKIKDIKDAIDKGELSVYVKKQQIIRHIPISKKSEKILKTLTNDETDVDAYFIHKRNCIRSRLNINGFTKELNDLLQMVLGKNYSSHSFRKGIITEMGVSGINPKIIQHFIAHKNVSTTLNYIKPTSNDIRNSLLR
ncbi:tyrosine-type recombinase/integrase [uncultured Desulfobacter sp.]|uniref:tyrosine-type recombinase/integrase n=1 Tax=uncultured Desulfobacter sp. TaxID=240139 RepID=UPI0029C8D664|nr:tyrosine-type recombinase/integrase [uncultured Desulfobacter sp.]